MRAKWIAAGRVWAYLARMENKMKTMAPSRRVSAPRLLLVDDHALFRTGLRMMLVSDNVACEIIEASSLDEAKHFIGTPIDVVLLDIQMPGINGLEGIAILKKYVPPHTHYFVVGPGRYGNGA